MGCGSSSYPPIQTTRAPPITTVHPQTIITQQQHQVLVPQQLNQVLIPQQQNRVLIPQQQNQVLIPQPTTLVNIQQPSAPPMQIPPSFSASVASPKQIEMPKITEEMVKDFQALSVVITELEQKNFIARLEAEEARQSELQKDIADLNQQYSMLDAKTKKEFEDVNKMNALAQSASISKFFASQHDFEAQFSKEEEEFIQAKTEQENCYQRLVKLQELSSQLSADIDRLKREKNDLLAQYAKQDAMLQNIFGGTYGSTLEDQLEEELDKMEDKHKKIKIAMEKWRNAEAFARAASGQLKYSCKRWFDVQQIPNKGSTQMVRIQAISETRNHLITAARNLTSSQRYLNPVKLPYCDASEVATLNKAITFIFIDGTTRDRHHHAMQVYQTSSARSVMLQKWIRNVIDQRISKDLAEVRQKCNECRSSLRKERISLMQKKVEEATGKTMDITWSDDSGIEADPEESVAVDSVAEADEVDDAQNLDDQIKQAKAENTEAEGDAAAALALVSAKMDEADKTPLDELAPAPSRNELFGDLDTIMAAYDQQKKALTDEQESARAKQEAEIKEKLRKRRSKLARLES